MHAESGGDEGLPIEQAELAVEVFRMLSDSTRVRLLCAWIEEELAVNELIDRLGKPAPSAYQHLTTRRTARRARTQRGRLLAFYRV